MNLSKKTLIFLTLIIFLTALLRIFHLGDIPPSLYTDEVDQGYNAYSILLTGRDEHGDFLPVSLRSFGDWKPPLPTYLMIPFIPIFGLSELSVRLPSAVLGIATVVLIFFLVRILFAQEKYCIRIGLLSAFYLAVSPLSILQSRAAMLVAIGLFFLMLGIYAFFLIHKNKLFIFLSATSFALSIYSYYGLRMISPLIALFLVIKFRKSLFFIRKEAILAGFFGLILLLPLFLSFIKQSDVIFGRAKTVSVFYDQGVNLRKWELITQDGIGFNPLFTRFFHNNLYMYGRSIVQRFLSHLDGKYLFLVGDQSQPFQVPQVGILNFADLVFIPLGIIVLFRRKYRSRWVILFLIFAAILPAAFTFVTPSSNRTFNAVGSYAILAAVGSIYAVKRNSLSKIITTIIITVCYSLGFNYFLHQYFIELPQNHADYWNYGWKEVVEYVSQKESEFDNILVSDAFGMPYIYFLFYQKYFPLQFQKTAIRPYVADRFGFEHVEGFAKYIFSSEFNWEFTKKYNLQKNYMYVVPYSQAANDTDYIKAIYYPNGKIAFKIFSYKHNVEYILK